MKINKFFAVLFASLFLFAGVAFAGPIAIATGGGSVSQYNDDYSHHNTGFGDKASSYAGGSTGAFYGYEASGKKAAVGAGTATAYGPDVNAWSFAKDFGKTSIAGAGASLEADRCDAVAVVGALGSDRTFFGIPLGGGKASTTAGTSLYGMVSQKNEAGETGYNGANAWGGNNSGAIFGVERSTTNGSFLGASANIATGIEGKLSTEGKTFVTVDPYGSTRSAYGMTENSAKVGANNFDCTGVYGSGGINAEVKNGFSTAAGGAGFNYVGFTSGNGQASVNAKVTPGSSTVSSSSFSSVK